ncbi:MAG: hypothetical protein WCG20_01700 [bacterium]
MEQKKKLRIVYTVLFAIAALVTVYYQYAYEKYNASWGGINIYLCAAVLSTAIALVMNYINYFIATKLGDSYSFDYKRFIPGPLVYGFLAIACLLSVYLGITYTEPSDDWSSGNTSSIAQNDRYQHSSFYHWYYIANNGDLGVGGGSSSSSSSSSSNDKAGEAYAVVALILLVVFILVLSAVVQHFWVIGSLAILLMMAQFLYRMWQDEPEPRNRYRQW